MRRFFSIKKLIEDKLKVFEPSVVEVVDESWMHQVGKETHFKLMVVSNKFEGWNLWKREYEVSQELREIWKKGVVTLSLVAKSPSEYEAYKSNTFVFEYPSHNDFKG